MNIIQQSLQTFLANPNNQIVHNGSFSVQQFNDLIKVINNTNDDFMMFNNGGGRCFDILFDTEAIEYILNNRISWVFCYQINKQQTVLKSL